MAESLPKFLRMSNTQAIRGGQSAKVTIETAGAQPFTIEIHHRNIEDIIRHLTLLAIDAMRMAGLHGKRRLSFIPVGTVNAVHKARRMVIHALVVIWRLS